MYKLIQLTVVTILLYSTIGLAAQMDENAEMEKNIQYRKQCLENAKFLVKNQYSVNCNYNYHHYNSVSYKRRYRVSKAKENKQVRIAGFNLWHPGTTKTMFKDYELVAKAMNNWDVVGALELLPVVSDDLRNNDAVIKFLASGDDLIRDLEQRIAKVKARRVTEKSIADLALYREKLSQLKKDLSEAPSLYRAPGYLKILTELRKLDESWALLLAPRGEAYKETDVQELSGFFYRSSIVRPTVNQYCKDIKTNGIGTPFACIPNFTNYFMGADYRHVFSRRPLMASFKSGDFDFTLLATHIVFNSSKDEEIKNSILQSVFGLTDLDDLGVGINKGNYARFAETATILRFMQMLRMNYSEDDIILVGDFNLEKSNPFWNDILREFPGANVLVDEPTSLTTQLYTGGLTTGGYASNYDHFVLDPENTSECDISSAKRENTTSGRIGYSIKRRYSVRSSRRDSEGNFLITSAGERRINRLVDALYKDLSSKKTISRNQVVPDTRNLDQTIAKFKRRMFEEQQYEQTYYRMYMEAMSDHAPISMNCSTVK